MKQPIWTQKYDVNTLVLDHRRQLGLVGLLKILQDAAWIHARHLDHGYEAMLEHGTLWVLTRFKLVIDEWPRWGDSIAIRTWVRPPVGPLANRDYEILAVDGRKLGEATAAWLTLDATTRRPLRLTLGEGALAVREDGALDLAPAKLAPRPDLPVLATVPARLSDLDVNGHVNNVCYAAWILDALPAETYETECLRDYEIAFLGESRLGDVVRLEGTTDGPGQRWFQALRDSDGKPVFAARLGSVPG